MSVKRCKRCGVLKSLDDFHKFSKSKDGVQGWCKDCTKEYQREYAQTDRGKAARKKAERKYYQTPKGKETDSKACRKYIQTPNGKVAIKRRDHKRRMLKYGTPKHLRITNVELKQMLEDATLCPYCGRKFNGIVIKTIDHVEPLSKGGLDTFDNISIICGSCNSRKKDRDFSEFVDILREENANVDSNFRRGQHTISNEGMPPILC